MQVILNIGLDGVPVNGETYTNGQRNPLEVEQLLVAVKTARALRFVVKRVSLLQSDSEPTAVVLCEPPAGNSIAVHQLAQRLNQDCIAVYDATLRRGELIGPNAEKWGAFNPAFFLQLDGTRLA